jgi:hypothetical protein
MGVKPAGNVSVTVTIPLVAPAPLLRTTSVYIAPVCSKVKMPVCDFVIARSETGAIGVRSVAPLLVGVLSPPPLTVAEFVTFAGAVGATLTVSVMMG